ncbi:MAG: hypothetical protein Rubg2KO_27290 [Rubricoccaceae bacterium]
MGGIPLYGQERGNIQVFHAVRSKGVDALFVTHKEFGHEAIQPALDDLKLNWTVASYPPRWGRGLSLGAIWSRLRVVRRGSRDFLRAAEAYRPTHIHTMNEKYFLDLYPAIRKLKLPMVYRMGDEPRVHHPVYRAVWKHLIIPRVSQFVANSQFIRQSLLNAGVPDQKVRVIYTYPPDRPEPEATDLPEDLLTPFAGRTVTYMGQLSKDKGVDLFVEAALQICSSRSDLRFILAGDYTWKNPFAESLIARVEAAGLSQQIRFIGFISDIDRLLSISDIHCAPSVWAEPLANTVLEAKRAKTPSVIFASGGLPELAVEQGRDAFLCPEKTADALMNGILHFGTMSSGDLEAASQEAFDSLGRLGISREGFAQAWADVYATL